MRTGNGSVGTQTGLARTAGPEQSPLAQFIRRSRSWTSERVPLPRRVRRLLWLLVFAQLGWAIWLGIVSTGSIPCAGPVCTLVTLDGQVTVLLACSVVSLAGLGALAVVTRGLSSTNRREGAGLTVSVAAGGVALLGVTALLCVIAILVFALAVLFGTMTVSP